MNRKLISNEETNKDNLGEENTEKNNRLKTIVDKISYKEKVRYAFLFITTLTVSVIIYYIRGEFFDLTDATYKLLVAFEGLIIVWLMKMARIPLRIKLSKFTRGKPFTSIIASPGSVSYLIGDTRDSEVEEGEHKYKYDDGPRYKRELFGAPCNLHVEGKSRPLDLSVAGQESQYAAGGQVVRVSGTVVCPSSECEFHNIGIPYETDVQAMVVGDNPDSNLLQKTSRLAEHKGFLKATLKMDRDDRNAKIKLILQLGALLGIGYVIWNQNEMMNWVRAMFGKVDEFARSSAEINNILVSLREVNETMSRVVPGRVERIQ